MFSKGGGGGVPGINGPCSEGGSPPTRPVYLPTSATLHCTEAEDVQKYCIVVQYTRCR